MLFTSWTFVGFVAVVFCLYYIPAFRRFQVGILVSSSIAFYAIDQAAMLPLLIVAVGATYLLLRRAMTVSPHYIFWGVAFNLALLSFFKYKLLFIDPHRFSTGTGLIDYLLALPLPIGISFFVFHNISLLVDASAKKTKLPRIAETFLYIIFFPQLVSGPIARSFQFLPQIKPKFMREVPVVSAVKWLICGYFFKLFAANNLNQLATFMNTPDSLGGLDRLVLIFVYSFQIYSDFFGYSAIAIGLALLFGYRLPINFDLPYLSSSFSEFWTRWHISLSTWLRTYLYIPIGGNRHGELRTYFNLMVVMLLGGLWHGAALSYLTWGAVHGLLLVVERPFLHRETILYARGGCSAHLAKSSRIAATFALVSLAWAFFRFPDFHTATAFLSGIVTRDFAATLPTSFYWLAAAYCLPAIVQHALALKPPSQYLMAIAEPLAYGAMLALALLEAGPDAPFIYFQF
ncbi:alginate O-acetyltransferase complex protein AlgI [Bradyrhizobium sp. GM2.4]